MILWGESKGSAKAALLMVVWKCKVCADGCICVTEASCRDKEM